MEKHVIARMRKGDSVFEIMVDSEKALKFRQDESVPIEEVLAAEHVFKEASKGLLASENQMEDFFGTSDPLEVAKIILEKGEVQITAEHKAKLREQKEKKLIEMIHMNGMDPRTKLPHPLERIKLAFEEAKIKIDDHRPADQQVDGIIKQLRPVLPISIEKKEVRIRIPPLHAGKGYSAVQGFGKCLREDWLTDGSFMCVVEIPAGMQNDLIDRINKITHGDVEIDIMTKGEK